jgi:hypothetical protein
MAMEIEYFDVDAEDIGEVGDVDAAAMVNGDGLTEQASPLVDIQIVPEMTTDQADAEYDAALAIPISDSEIESMVHLATSNMSPQQMIAYYDMRREVEERHERDIAEHKETHTIASLAREQAEAIYKDAKAEEKSALSALSNLIRRGPQYPPDPSQASAIDQAVSSGGERSAITLDDPDADQSWRAITTLSLLDGIKGLGDKKRDAIISLAPTLGDLEELRGKASIAHKQFSEVLPKGVGSSLADEIEERICSAMTKHQLAIESAKVAVVDGGENADQPGEEASDDLP